ncbi:MAG: c-type cytochrome [Betaproteobacteria bacterium]
MKNNRHERSVGLVLTGAVLLLQSGLATAQTSNLDVAAKAASCNACHGPYGQSQAGIPTLEGRSADDMFTSLKGFANGQRAAYVMHHHAKGYSDQELRDIATYFAQQKPRARR